MPALQVFRSPQDEEPDPVEGASAFHAPATDRVICPHYSGTENGWDATCARNETPEPIHTAFQRIHCTSRRHERCQVFLGEAPSPLQPDTPTRRRPMRMPMPNRLALSGVLGLALVVGASFFVGSLPGIGAGSDEAPVVAPPVTIEAAQPEVSETATEPDSTGADAMASDSMASDSTASALPEAVLPVSETAAAGSNNTPQGESAEPVTTTDGPADTTIDSRSTTRLIGGPPAFLPALIPFLIALQYLELAPTLDPGLSEDLPDETTDLPPNLEAATGLYRVKTTSGNGVAHRSACISSARMNTGWVDGQHVELLGTGVDGCEGWSYAQAGGIAAWIQSGFLIPVS